MVSQDVGQTIATRRDTQSQGVRPVRAFAERTMVTLTACTFPAVAYSQSAIQAAVPDVIAQTVAGMSAGWPADCLSLKWKEKPASVARFARDAEPGLRAYLALAATGADPKPAYKRNWVDRWTLDGAVTKDLRDVHDPWARATIQLRPAGLMLGRSEVFGRGIWRAYNARGTLLGTYDATMIRSGKGYMIGALKLWSPGRTNELPALTPFCAMPGDHEEYMAEQAKRAKRKAEKQAQSR